MAFRFELKSHAAISASGEKGEVIGRAEYSYNSEAMYLLRYKCADGRAVEIWWSDNALEPASK